MTENQVTSFIGLSIMNSDENNTTEPCSTKTAASMHMIQRKDFSNLEILFYCVDLSRKKSACTMIDNFAKLLLFFEFLSYG